ncbi:MAG: ribosome assembly cofactor RimP [Bacteroidales bacterium]
MISVKQIEDLLEESLVGTSLFKVEVRLSSTNVIRIFVDGPDGVHIEECVKISRYIESHLDREIEDFELTVSSSGLDQPLKVLAQYKKNIGLKVEVLTTEGEVVCGILKSATVEEIEVEPEPIKGKGRKKIAIDTVVGAAVGSPYRHIKYTDIKETKIVISFK